MSDRTSEIRVRSGNTPVTDDIHRLARDVDAFVADVINDLPRDLIATRVQLFVKRLRQIGVGSAAMEKLARELNEEMRRG